MAFIIFTLLLHIDKLVEKENIDKVCSSYETRMIFEHSSLFIQSMPEWSGGGGAGGRVDLSAAAA